MANNVFVCIVSAISHSDVERILFPEKLQSFVDFMQDNFVNDDRPLLLIIDLHHSMGKKTKNVYVLLLNKLVTLFVSTIHSILSSGGSHSRVQRIAVFKTCSIQGVWVRQCSETHLQPIRAPDDLYGDTGDKQK